MPETLAFLALTLVTVLCIICLWMCALGIPLYISFYILRCVYCHFEVEEPIMTNACVLIKPRPLSISMCLKDPKRQVMTDKKRFDLYQAQANAFKSKDIVLSNDIRACIHDIPFPASMYLRMKKKVDTSVPPLKSILKRRVNFICNDHGCVSLCIREIHQSCFLLFGNC